MFGRGVAFGLLALAVASSAGVRLALGLNAAAVLALGLLPGPLLDLCARVIH